MWFRTFGVVVVALLSAYPAHAAELRVYPPEVTVAGPNRTQQLIVVMEENGRAVGTGDLKATYASSNPSVAKVSPSGLVTATGPGEATITATTSAKPVTIKVTVSGPPGEWNFRNHVMPAFTKNGCNSGACHGALAGKGGFKLSLRGYDPESDYFALTRQANARRTNLTHPAESLFIRKAIRLVPHGGGSRFEEGSDPYVMMLNWVQSGAPGLRENDARLERIEVFPRAALLKPKESFQVVVRASYSNGTVEDVTRWSKFGSTDELVASTTDDGKVTVAGYGEASITVNFGTKVTTLTVTSPYPSTPDPALFRKAARNNFVDDHLTRKLELLRIPPSGPCSDVEFIRRVFLDTCGILPTPVQTTRFLNDPDPRKREKLIDFLLEQPAYVDYWSYKWSDMLLVSSRKLPQPAMWSFYRFVRQSVADNEPWDQFARRVVTATGSTLTNGAGNYFVLHKDVSELAESTAVTFLGMSITCARCHNHPLEKWTQDEYWAFANLFARVSLKNGDRPGEVFVQSRADGDALHLRRGIPMLPTPLDGKPLSVTSPVDRRTYFADWLTDRGNPYFAKALVNRVWKNFLGRGLVEAEDDLRETNPPSNQELLDALAADFIAHKFDIKHLIRTVLNSAAYQRSSKPLAENSADDRFYSHYLLRRLPAEVILDAYSDVTGVPTAFTQLKSNAGDSVTPTQSYPIGTRAMQLPDSLASSRFLEAFGRADRIQTCSCERSADASVTQALHLNNGVTLNDKLRDAKSVVSKWLEAKATDTEIIDRIFLAALSRTPTPAERAKFLPILADAAKDGPAIRREAIEDFVWAVLTGHEFLFNH